MSDTGVEAEFGDAFAEFRSSVFRLETLQTYRAPEEAEMLRAFLAGEPRPTRVPAIEEWAALVRDARRDGRTVQRVHIVQHPLTDYVRFELTWGYDITVAAGEDVRILPLAPGEPWPPDVAPIDFWLFDDRQLYTVRYQPDGEWAGVDRLRSAAQIAAARQWRDAALRRAVPWADYMRQRPGLVRRAS